MKRTLFLALLAPLALAACADERLTPAPGEAPGWPSQSPPRPSYAPLPFTTNYTPATATQTQPPVAPGENVPYAVRGQQAAPSGSNIQWNQAGGQSQNCHAVPTGTACQQADGTWAYIPD